MRLLSLFFGISVVLFVGVYRGTLLTSILMPPPAIAIDSLELLQVVLSGGALKLGKVNTHLHSISKNGLVDIAAFTGGRAS